VERNIRENYRVLYETLFKEDFTMGKITVSTLAEKIIFKRHYLVVDKSNVLDVIDIINRQFKYYRDQHLVVGRHKLAKDCTDWSVDFDATDNQWKAIMSELHTYGYELKLKPHDPKEIFVIENKWPVMAEI
jgi:hypothetical protein